MFRTVFQIMRDSFSFSGAAKKAEGPHGPGPRDYTPSELALLRQQLKASNEEARAEVRRRGVRLHPKIAAAREK